MGEQEARSCVNPDHDQYLVRVPVGSNKCGQAVASMIAGTILESPTVPSNRSPLLTVCANHEYRVPKGIVLERYQALKPGQRMGDLPEHLQHKSFVRVGDKKTGGPNLRLYRLEPQRPCLTVTAFIFNKFVHPSEDRCITAREAAVIQDFPADYRFTGSQGEVHKQIGNAVPVKLASASNSSSGRNTQRVCCGGSGNWS